MDAPLQYGRIFLRSHGDCFIHATDHWLKYWNASASREQLLIVRVTLPNESVFISTLSPTAIPYGNAQKGVSRRRYLEIDPKFAAELGISQDTEVGVESVREVEHCMSFTIAPVNPSDYEKLEQFQEKIDYELVEKIRVVSCQSFSFPIWIGNVVIPVKVVSSEPSAKWVLIVPGRTELHILKEAASQTANTLSALSSTPGRSSSQGSDHSTENEELSKVQGCLPKTHWDFNHGKKQHRVSRHSSTTQSSTTSNSALTSPDTESDGMNISLSSLLNLGKKYLPFSFSQAFQAPVSSTQATASTTQSSTSEHSPYSSTNNLQQTRDSGIALSNLQPQSGSGIVSRGGVVSSQPPRKSEGQQPGGGWGGRVLPPVMEGKPHAHYHTQPQNLLNELKSQQQRESDVVREGMQTPDVYPSRNTTSAANDLTPKPVHRRYNTWHSETDFTKVRQQKESSPSKYLSTLNIDVKVRVQSHSLSGIKPRPPSPDLSPTPEGCWNWERLFDVFVHPSTIPEIHLYRQTSHLLESLLVELRPVHSTPQQEPSKETAVRKAEAAAEGSLAADINDLTPQNVDEKSDAVFAKSLVVRLCFATNIICREDGIHPQISDDLLGFINDKDGERMDDCGTIVQPGHILVSDYVRRQLGVKVCSSVKLLHVKDGWRIPYAPSKPIIVLQPLGKTKMNYQTDELSDSFKCWVEEVSNVADVGSILVNKQIIPLAPKHAEWVACRVNIRGLQLPPSPSYTRIVPYFLITPHDIDQSRVDVKVQLRSQQRDQQLTKHQQYQKDQATSLEDIKLPDTSTLNLPDITQKRSHFGALEDLLKDGCEYIRAVFSQNRRSGAMLVCGVANSGGAGCGKSSLARLLCKTASQHPYYASVAILDCTSLRGQTSHRVKKRLTLLFNEAISHQPSVILLDALDHSMPVVNDVQDQIGEEGNASTSKTQTLLNLMLDVRSRGCNVLVVATAQNRQQLNKDLLQSRGEHIFEKCLEINPPSLVERKAILEAILFARELTSLCDADLRTIALKTEGFQAGDLVTLTDRALHYSEVRPFNSAWASSSRLELPFPMEAKNQMDVSPEVNSDVLLCSSPPIATPPSPKKLHPALEALRAGESGTLTNRRKKISILSSESAVTLIPERFQKSLSLTGLILEDFLSALEGFVPLSLRGLSLHAAGVTDFSSIGGLEEAKQTLTETLLWPSKYPNLFSQCPIKQRCGVLLYGAPGTGKTLLAAAVAKEFGLNFVSIKGPELLTKYIGQSEQAVRDVFTRAQSAKPCILFFDEFDSLAPRRGHDNTGVTDRVVNQLLTQLDGVEALYGVYVLAASSRPDLIDPALLRPGRIDRTVFCDVPEASTRLKILKVLGKDILDTNINLSDVVTRTKGFTGADFKALLYNAQLIAAHEVLDKRKKLEEQQQVSSKVDFAVGKSNSAKLFVFECTSSGLRRNDSPPPELQTKAVLLHEKLMQERKASLITLRDESRRSLISSISHVKQSGILISQEQLMTALEGAKQSVSTEERKKYDKIYNRFTGETKMSTTDIEQKTTMS